MTDDRMTVCPECGGTGEVYRWPDIESGVGGWEECADCDGTGYVAEEVANAEPS